MTINKFFGMTAAAAMLSATAASAQLFGDEIGTDYDDSMFRTGFAETGYYDALDRDGDAMLSENEYATGLYADYDRDNDVRISQEEFDLGTDRYYRGEYAGGAFTDYDSDGDGFLNQEEFGGFYGTDKAQTFTTYDADSDGFLNADEYGSSVYTAADRDQDKVLTVEEEGFFEGWFDGDDVEAELENVGEVY